MEKPSSAATYTQAEVDVLVAAAQEGMRNMRLALLQIEALFDGEGNLREQYEDQLSCALEAVESALGERCEFVGGSLDHFPEICDRCGKSYKHPSHRALPLAGPDAPKPAALAEKRKG